MRKPIVGVLANAHLINDQYWIQGSSRMNVEAIADAADAMPLIIPSLPGRLELDDILPACDGFLLTGGRPNVHPEEYGHKPTAAHGDFDRDRDGIALPLIRSCVERGQPILGVCRGFQEFNVAMGGTLHYRVHQVDGFNDHRMPREGDIEHKFSERHIVVTLENGQFHRLCGQREVMVNSLHAQAVKEVAPEFEIECVSIDGVIEGISHTSSKAFCVGVQWHAEWRFENNVLSDALWKAFGNACRERAGERTGNRVAAE